MGSRTTCSLNPLMQALQCGPKGAGKAGPLQPGAVLSIQQAAGGGLGLGPVCASVGSGGSCWLAAQRPYSLPDEQSDFILANCRAKRS